MEPMQNMPLVFSAMAFFAICLLFYGAFQALQARAQRIRTIDKIRAQNPGGFSGRFTPELATEGRSEAPMAGFFQKIGKSIAPDTPEDYSRMKLNFYRAGIRNPNSPAIFWGVKGFLLIALPIGFLLFQTVLPEPLNMRTTLVIAVLLATLGFYLPNLWLYHVSAKRKQLIFEGFPDALDLLVICVEAGMGLDSALARAGEEIKLSNKPLSDELNFLTLEIRAGKTREESLHNLALRTGIDDVQNLVTLLIQTDRFGTSVARALRVFSDTFRTKRFQRAEEIAAKLPVKMVFPVTVFIFPSLFLVIAGPAAIRVYQTFFQ